MAASVIKQKKKKKVYKKEAFKSTILQDHKIFPKYRRTLKVQHSAAKIWNQQ